MERQTLLANRGKMDRKVSIKRQKELFNSTVFVNSNNIRIPESVKHFLKERKKPKCTK